jgi:large subunit ribosomal protein L2
MGKRIIQQARGKGSLTYKVRKKAFRYKLSYPMHEGEAEIVNLIHSPGHTAPLMKLKISTPEGDEVFYNPAFNGAFIGQKVEIGSSNIKEGNIMSLENIPSGTKIFNIEKNPGDGGKMMRAAGASATVSKKLDHRKMTVLMPNKKEVIISADCRATIGTVAGSGKTSKPFMTAGKKFHKMKALGKIYPKISAVSVNAIDHPFGSGRGKRIKSKIARRDASPGRKVGHLRPRRTGKRK